MDLFDLQIFQKQLPFECCDILTVSQCLYKCAETSINIQEQLLYVKLNVEYFNIHLPNINHQASPLVRSLLQRQSPNKSFD